MGSFKIRCFFLAFENMYWWFIIIVVTIMIYYYVHENFSGFNYMRFYDRVPWATYSSIDGSFLNMTFRQKIHRVDYDFTHGPVYCELWGYVGKGIPEAEDYGNLFANPNWEILLLAHDVKKKDTFYIRHNYEAYHLVLVY